jgi:hypothetical protein
LVPLCVSKGITLTQFDKDGVEAAGMLKMDILGSKYLSVIDKALELIEQRHGIQLHDTDMDDKEAYDMICSGDVSGIFQLGQECAKEIVQRMQPRSFNDLVQLISIGRPGVISSDLVDKYFEAKSLGNIRYPHPAFGPILKETLEVIIYQEQIMRIAVEIVGFDWSEADELRKAVAKQKVEVMEPFKDKFIAGLITNGVPQQTAEKLWEKIIHFGSYCFNKAHAVGYAKLTKVKFKDFTIEYIELCKKNNTQKHYATKRYVILKSLVPFFGSKTLLNIQATDIEAYISKRQQESASQKTLLNEYTLLKHMFNQAIRWDYLRANPCVKVDRPKIVLPLPQVLTGE